MLSDLNCIRYSYFSTLEFDPDKVQSSLNLIVFDAFKLTSFIHYHKIPKFFSKKIKNKNTHN